MNENKYNMECCSMLLVHIITHSMLIVNYSFMLFPFHVNSELLSYIISSHVNSELLDYILS